MFEGGGVGGSWAIDVLDAQLGRLRGARGELENLRPRLASIGDDMVWRSRAAGGFHRDMEDWVSGADQLVEALRDLERSIRSTRVRLLRAEQLAG
mgnify:FL=1